MTEEEQEIIKKIIDKEANFIPLFTAVSAVAENKACLWCIPVTRETESIWTFPAAICPYPCSDSCSVPLAAAYLLESVIPCCLLDI